MPRPMGAGFFFSKVVQRKDAFKDLLDLWGDAFSDAGDRTKVALVALPAAPGTGKTRFAQVVAARGKGGNVSEAEWEEAFKAMKEGDFKNSVKQAVAVTVTFNSDIPMMKEEQPLYMIGVRMLHSHFCRGSGFAKFYQWLQDRTCEKVEPYDALRLIRWDMKQNGFPDGYVILVVDETLRAVESNSPAMRRQLLG